jgi:hypothetical protein
MMVSWNSAMMQRPNRTRIRHQDLTQIMTCVTNSAKFAPKLVRASTAHLCYINEDGTMRGFHNSSFDPQTLVVLEAAFDEAWLTLKAIGNTTVKPDELARCVLRLAMEGERDPVRLHDGALKGLIPATSWREAG